MSDLRQKWLEAVAASALRPQARLILQLYCQDTTDTTPSGRFTAAVIHGYTGIPENNVPAFVLQAYKAGFLFSDRYYYGQTPLVDDLRMPCFEEYFDRQKDAQFAAQKPKEPKPTKTQNYAKSNLLTLQEWEAKVGATLSAKMLPKFIKTNRLCEAALQNAVLDFRNRVIARGAKYADFVAAFRVYLSHGWLNCTLDDLKVENSRYSKEGYADQEFSKGVKI